MIVGSQGLNACIVTIEHRWYGESLPGGTLLNKALLTQTLTVDLAMQDVRLLMTYFETNVSNVTWFLVGGSYSLLRPFPLLVCSAVLTLASS